MRKKYQPSNKADSRIRTDNLSLKAIALPLSYAGICAPYKLPVRYSALFPWKHFQRTSTKVKVRIELTIVDLWSTALPLGYFTIYNTPSGCNLINSAIFSHGDDKSELDNRHCQASYHCLAPIGLTTCKFHGSFRIELYCKQRFCFYCHTATLTKFLCYTHISTLQGKLDCLSFLHC